MKTTVAKTAQAIRAELKTAYPSTKFSVRSSLYSGGDSINVSYALTVEHPRPLKKDVEALLSKFESGHFNGMEDIYEYDSSRGELTTKYLFVDADTSALQAFYKQPCMQYWGLETDNDQDCQKKHGMWFSQLLYRYINDVVLA